MLQDKLENFGLTNKEARVYLATLELGETNIARISKKSKIKRTTVYDIIEALKEEGLVGVTIKNKKRYYFVSDPRELEEKMDEKKNILRSAMPELLSRANLIDKKPKIRYYEGAEGIKEVYHDALKYPNQPVWGWLADQIFTSFGEFLKHFISRRIKAKIMAYVIAPDTPKVRELQSLDVQSLRKIKIDSLNPNSIKVEIDMYGNNKIAIISFEEHIALIMESKAIYDTLRAIFDAHWNSLN